MNIHSRDYIKNPPTQDEIQRYNDICESEKIGKYMKRNKRSEYPEAIRHFDSLFPNNHIELCDCQNNYDMEANISRFKKLIHEEGTNERDVLKFINHTPAYYIVASLFKYYNFGHHDAYIFPEFKINQYRADYLLIGKSSGGYEFVLVEFELPNGRITLNSGHEGQAPRKGTFQIYDWKYEIEADFATAFAYIKKYSNKTSLSEEFTRFDPSRFHYAVVAGVRDDYNETTYRDRRNKLKEQDIMMLHYDNIIDKSILLIDDKTF